MRASIAHASFGFALAAALWSLNLLPSLWPNDEAVGLAGRHATENSAALRTN
jgi:hypothetical protein